MQVSLPKATSGFAPPCTEICSSFSMDVAKRLSLCMDIYHPSRGYVAMLQNCVHFLRVSKNREHFQY